MYDLNANRAYLRLNHHCRDCLKIDAYTLSGRPKCYECMQRENKRKRDKRRLNSTQYNCYQRERRKQLKEEHRCSVCGKELPKDYSYLLCEKCKLKPRLKKRERDQKKIINYPRGANGICYQCNKKPVMEGKRLCEDCYAGKMKCLEKAMQKNREIKEHEKAE